MLYSHLSVWNSVAVIESVIRLTVEQTNGTRLIG